MARSDSLARRCRKGWVWVLTQWVLAAVFICACIYVAALVLEPFALGGITLLPPGLVYREN